VVDLSREAFDAIEFDAACSGDHRAAAVEMTRLANTGTHTDAMPRSEAHVRAGEQWLLADDPAAAVEGFTSALQDGGPSTVDPRVPLARALFLLGNDDEAEALLHDLSAEPPRDARMCDMLAELLVERSDLPAALAWATAGVELCFGREVGPVGLSAPRPAAQREARQQAGQPAKGTGAKGTQGTAGRTAGLPGRGAAVAGGSGRGARPALLERTVGAGVRMLRLVRSGSAHGAVTSHRSRAGTGTLAGQGPVDVPALASVADENELRLLLTLRFRIRNDLGLPEDDYDRLLDDLRLRPTDD
jgi:Tetratricopeptide repeat